MNSFFIFFQSSFKIFRYLRQDTIGTPIVFSCTSQFYLSYFVFTAFLCYFFYLMERKHRKYSVYLKNLFIFTILYSICDIFTCCFLNITFFSCTEPEIFHFTSVTPNFSVLFLSIYLRFLQRSVFLYHLPNL